MKEDRFEILHKLLERRKQIKNTLSSLDSEEEILVPKRIEFENPLKHYPAIVDATILDSDCKQTLKANVRDIFKWQARKNNEHIDNLLTDIDASKEET